MAISLKRLKQFFPDEQARKIRRLITGEIDPRQFSSVEKWVSQCYNEPSADEMVMCAIDELIGGYGVEAIHGRYVDSYHGEIQAAYVNMGDTYDITILLDHETGEYRLTSYGDWVEANERKRELV